MSLDRGWFGLDSISTVIEGNGSGSDEEQQFAYLADYGLEDLDLDDPAALLKRSEKLLETIKQHQETRSHFNPR
jgi:hypothetical protein